MRAGRLILSLVLLGSAALAFAGGAAEKPSGSLRVAFVVREVNNPFFQAVRTGGEEAARDLGGVEVLYQGTDGASAAVQAEVVTSLIEQKVDAIAVSAVDPEALLPVAKKALAAGVKVISFDTPMAPDGRILHLIPTTDEAVGRAQVKALAELTENRGGIAVLGTSPRAAGQNAWIEWMKKELASHPDMSLEAVVYGDDLPDRSAREVTTVLRSYPDLKGIVATSPNGLEAAARTLEAQGLAGKVMLTGIGLPSAMKPFVDNGTCGKVTAWNAVDLGYCAVSLAVGLARGRLKGRPGESIEAGRMGTLRVDGAGTVTMGAPLVLDRDTIDQLASLY